MTAASGAEVVRILHMQRLRVQKVQVDSWRHEIDRIPVLRHLVRWVFGQPSRAISATVKNIPVQSTPEPAMPIVSMSQINSWTLNPPPGVQKLNKVDQAMSDAGIGYGLGKVRDQVDRVLTDFVPDDLNDLERESWFFHRARGADDGHDRTEAMRRAQASFRMMPESAKIRLQLVRQHEYAGQTDEMFRLIDNMKLRPHEMGYAMVAAHFAYLWDDYDRGVKSLQPLLDFYRPGMQVNPAHNIPNIAAPLWSLAGLCASSGSIHVAQSSLDKLTQRFGENPEPTVQMFVTAVKSCDFNPLIKQAEETLTFSEGMLPLQSAILRAQQTISPIEASRIVAAVKIPSWRHDLDSVRHIFMSGLAREAGEDDQQHNLTQHVLGRMPMLLAPELVGFFNLAESMDSFKEAYRSTRQG